jgi:hypothetical protein
MKDQLTNLLQETLDALSANEKSPSDVEWVGSDDGWFTWDEFATVAAAADYEAWFGSAKVAQDLIVSGNGFWLERGEYDGSEWWEFKTSKKRPVYRRAVDALTVNQGHALGRDDLSCGCENLAQVAGWSEDGK